MVECDTKRHFGDGRQRRTTIMRRPRMGVRQCRVVTVQPPVRRTRERIRRRRPSSDHTRNAFARQRQDLRPAAVPMQLRACGRPRRLPDVWDCRRAVRRCIRPDDGRQSGERGDRRSGARAPLSRAAPPSAMRIAGPAPVRKPGRLSRHCRFSGMADKSGSWSQPAA